jgi:steroid 5-alpha reductase family enzyme
VLLASAAAIVALVFGTWLLSLAWRDASIVDPVWPLGFVAVAWVTRVVADGDPASGSSWP